MSNSIRHHFFKFLKLAIRRPSRIKDIIYFIRTYREWQRKAPLEWKASLNDLRPCLNDRKSSAGNARGHYFLQDIWAAQKVHQFAHDEHVDIGSSVEGFVAHVASFAKKVIYVDIRPLETGVPNIVAQEGSICKLPFADQSIQSLSCLHVIEHIGLGRYGDPLDPDGWLHGMKELQRVLAPGGQLLIGTPCGRQRVVFHAHRVFTPTQIVEALPDLRLEEFSCVQDDDAKAWVSNAALSFLEKSDYGCGFFRFTRPA